MRKINTVTGEITPQQMGRTLMHEHFFFGWCGHQYDASSGQHWRKEEVIDYCVSQAKLLKAQGFQTVLDATASDCGRNAEWLREISERSELQIICVTGCFAGEFTAKGYWNLRARVSDAEKEIEELMTMELTKGIDGTGIKAGAIKVAAANEEISPYDKRFFVAAARTQAKLGCVVTTHTEDGRNAKAETELLLENGVDPAKTIIGHMCGDLNPSHHIEIMKRGFYIGFDRIGAYDDHPSDEARIETLKVLRKEGWLDKIVMSQDVITRYLGRPFTWPDNEKEDWRHYYFGYLQEDFLPMLRKAGFTDEDMDKIFIDNPRQIFG